jgi:tetratricopeptide (TPR) repeat protein
VTTSIVNIVGVFRGKDPFACVLRKLDRGDFAAAETALSDLLDGVPAARDRAFLLNKRGVARIGLQRFEAARADFAAALEASPAYPPALTNLGNLLLEEGAIDAAIVRYESAVAADPDYGIAYLNLGVAYKRAGRIGEAVRAMRRAHRLNAAGFWRPARRR